MSWIVVEDPHALLVRANREVVGTAGDWRWTVRLTCDTLPGWEHVVSGRCPSEWEAGVAIGDELDELTLSLADRLVAAGLIPPIGQAAR